MSIVKILLRIVALVVVVCVAMSSGARASAGALDRLFGHSGFTLIPHVVYSVNDVKIDANGRILVSADFQGLGNAVGGFGIARLLPNGSPDLAFGVQGVAVAEFS